MNKAKNDRKSSQLKKGNLHYHRNHFHKKQFQGLRKFLALYFTLGFLGIGYLANAVHAKDRVPKERAVVMEVYEPTRLPEARSIDNVVESAPSTVDEAQNFYKETQTESKKTPAPVVQVKEGEKKEKKSKWWLYALGALAVIAGGVYLATKKKKKTPDNGPDGPNGPTKITQSGKITDVLSNDSVSGANVGCSESSDTSDTSGNYTIQYTQGTTPEIKITHNSHVERNTYPDYGPDYSIIPNSFSMEEFNRICREAYSGTVRWPLEPENKPIVYITTDDGPPKYVEDIIRDVVNNSLLNITKNVLSNLTIQKGSRAEAPAKGALIYDYDRSRITDSGPEDHDSNNIIYWAEVRIGGSNEDGSKR